MKHIVALVVAAAVFAGAQSVLAGGACCASKAAAKEGCGTSSAACVGMFDKLNLTADQKAKIAELEKTCQTEGKTKESCEKYIAEMKKVLTAEQLAAFDAACKKSEETPKTGT
jgi:Spy/CpxP family protein refolding chaperone